MLVLGKVLGSPSQFPKSRADFLQYESSTGDLSLQTSKVTLQTPAGLSCPLLKDLWGCITVCIAIAFGLFFHEAWRWKGGWLPSSLFTLFAQSEISVLIAAVRQLSGKTKTEQSPNKVKNSLQRALLGILSAL